MRDDPNWLRAAGDDYFQLRRLPAQFGRRPRLVPGQTEGRVRLDGVAAGGVQVGAKLDLGPETEGPGGRLIMDVSIIIINWNSKD